MKRALLVFIIAVLTGFAVGVHFNYVKHGSSPANRLQELVLFANDTCYHIHHSMFLALFAICIAFGRFVANNDIVIGVVGLMVGASLMDLLYPDWDLVRNNCHRNKIMHFFTTHQGGA